MNDIKLVPHDTDWWILNGKVRQGPYINFRLASRIALTGRNSLQRVVVLNQVGEVVMYWEKAIDQIASVAVDQDADQQGN